MKSLILAVALAAGCTLASSAPALAAAKNSTVDCSKPENAKQAACKDAAAKAAKAADKAAKADAKAKAKAAKEAAKTAAKATKPAPAAKPAPKTAAATKPAAMPKTVTPPAAAPAVEDKNPAGAIAQCKDGTYSHAKNRTGACSKHGGVAKWS